MEDEDDSFISNPHCVPVNVFCSGANEHMSLGNPLGTSKRQRILFKSYSTFVPTKVVFGAATTIFLSENRSPTVFVAGKFGNDHFMTPQPFLLNTVVNCAAIAQSHAIICCEGLFYCIGDNTNNQLGLGTGRPYVDKLTSYEPPFKFNAVHCATSARHTVVLTPSELYVSGVNFGQIGEYASRAFQQSNSMPKTFFPMLRSGDSLLTGAGVAVSDVMTVIYSGNRARIFYEYREYSLFFVCREGSARIVHATVCRLPTSQATFVLFFSAPDASLYLWQRHGNGKSLRPIWVLPDEEMAGSYRRQLLRAVENLVCTRKGDFYIAQNEYVFHGSVVLDSDGQPYVATRRIGGLPGFVRDVFASPDGKNLAFIVAANAAADVGQQHFESTNRRDQTLARRFVRLQSVRHNRPTVVVDNTGRLGRFVRVDSKSHCHVVHRFMLAVRAPFLLMPRWLKSGVVDLRRINDQTVSELLEYIYTGTSAAFRAIGRLATPHMLRCILKWKCDVCGQRDPTIQFPWLDDRWKLSELPATLSTSENDDGVELNNSAVCSNNILQPNQFDDDLTECLESGLTRMRELARDLRWRDLQRCVDIAIDILTEECFSKKKLDGKFLNDTLDIGNVFVEEDELLLLECDDGQRFTFPKELLLESPYFQALFRWHGGTASVQLDGISSEMLRVALKFFLSQELEDQLSFEQIIELLFFADHYSFFDLEWAAAHLLEKELHMDNIEEVIELANTLYLIRLIEAIVVFIIRHWALFMESRTRKAIIVRRLPNFVRTALLQERKIEAELTKLLTASEQNDSSEVREGLNELANDFATKSLKQPKPDKALNYDDENAENFTSDQEIFDQSVGSKVTESAGDWEKEYRTVAGVVDDQPDLHYSRVTTSLAAAGDVVTPTVPTTSSTCWKVSPAVVAVPIIAQLETAAGFIASSLTQKHWKKHRNTEKKVFLRRSGERLLKVNDNSTISSPRANLPAWNSSLLGAETSPQPITSLADIMREESLMQSSQLMETSVRTEQPAVKASSNWGQSFIQATTIDDKSPNAIKSLWHIQAEETAAHRRRVKADERRASKPLHCVAVEERAIRELEQYYESVYANSDVPAYFIVRREEKIEDVGLAANASSSNHSMNFGRVAGAKHPNAEPLRVVMKNLSISQNLKQVPMRKNRNILSTSVQASGRLRTASGQ